LEVRDEVINIVVLKHYIDEYLMICKVLREKGNKFPWLQDCAAIDREHFEKVLKANNFDDYRNKIRIWKNLNWIQASKKTFTKNVKINNKCKRMVVVNLKPSYILEKINY